MVEKSHGAAWWPDFFEPLRQAGQHIADWFQPRSDARAAQDVYRIGLELPGVRRENIEIALHDGVMTVRGEKKHVETTEGEGYFFSERQYGRFQRSFRLPADAAEDGIEARFEDGVLTITVPKVAPSPPETRRIPIG